MYLFIFDECANHLEMKAAFYIFFLSFSLFCAPSLTAAVFQETESQSGVREMQRSRRCFMDFERRKQVRNEGRRSKRVSLRVEKGSSRGSSIVCEDIEQTERELFMKKSIAFLQGLFQFPFAR